MYICILGLCSNVREVEEFRSLGLGFRVDLGTQGLGFMGYIGAYICISIFTGIHNDIQVTELYMDTWGLFRVIQLYRGTLGYTG